MSGVCVEVTWVWVCDRTELASGSRLGRNHRIGRDTVVLRVMLHYVSHKVMASLDTCMLFADIAPVIMDIGGSRWLIVGFFDSSQPRQVRITLLADTYQSVQNRARSEQDHLNSPSSHRLLGSAREVIGVH